MNNELKNILRRVGLSESFKEDLIEDSGKRDFTAIYRDRAIIKSKVVRSENVDLKNTINNLVDYSMGRPVKVAVSESLNYRELLAENNYVIGMEKVLGLGKTKELKFVKQKREKIRKAMAKSTGATPVNMTDSMDDYGVIKCYFNNEDICKAVEITEGPIQSLSGRDRFNIGDPVDVFKNKMDKFLGRDLLEKPNEFFDRKNNLHIRFKDGVISSVYMEWDGTDPMSKVVKAQTITQLGNTIIKTAIAGVLLVGAGKMAHGAWKVGSQANKMGNNIKKVNDMVGDRDWKGLVDGAVGIGGAVAQAFRNRRGQSTETPGTSGTPGDDIDK